MCDPKVTSVTLYPLKGSPGTAGGCPDSLGMEQIERMNVTCVIKKRKRLCNSDQVDHADTLKTCSGMTC